MTGAALREFMRSVAIGLPGVEPNEWVLQFLEEWARWEGTNARNNPLATTRIIGRGETSFNSHGVKNYASIADGVLATVQTLKLSYYTEIVTTLRAQRIDNRELLAAQLYTPGVASWGTSGFASLIRNGWQPNPAPTVPADEPETDNRDTVIATLRDELARMNEAIHRRFDWIAYGASQAEQPNYPPPAPQRPTWSE